MKNLKAASIFIAKVVEKRKERETPFQEMSILEKIEILIDLPFVWLRKITIPPAEEDRYDKYLTMAWCFFGVYFIIWGFFRDFRYWWIYAVLPICLVCFCFVFFTHRGLKRNEPPNYYILLEVLASVGGLLWTYIVSEILIG